ncbi:unnamed protein product [Coregonus sp. 'balchen']|nr:unnamed protein product [Coregonus sp. 'balchen']
MRLPIHSLSLISRSFSDRLSAIPGRRGVCGAAMRLVQFCRQGDEGGVRVGVDRGEGLGVIDLKAFDPSMPMTMRELLEMGAKGMQCAQRALEASPTQCVVPFAEVRLLSPVLAPEKVEVDWEVELAFVIGRKGKHIKEEDAMSYVAGFTVANDVSARDWQMKRNGKQWLLGKTFDSFCPLGPALVTTSAVMDPHNLGIRCLVNGVAVQNSNTNQLIFKTEQVVAWVSQFVTLSPGDVFLTGTPPGVGVFRNPPVFLKKGDVVECQIDQVGVIRNNVV